MEMITELVLEEIKVKGGMQIKVAQYPTPNKTLFDGCFFLSKLLLWMMECRSNDMTRAIQARDVEKVIWPTWNNYKTVMDFSQKNSNSPVPVYTMLHKILLPHPKEMRRYKNMKIQAAAFEIYTHMHVIMSRDSSSGTHIYEMADYDEILESQKVTEDKLNLYLGTGKLISAGKWDTGLEMASMVELGEVRPKLDFDFIEFQEPSSDDPQHHLKDAPDLEIEKPE